MRIDDFPLGWLLLGMGVLVLIGAIGGLTFRIAQTDARPAHYASTRELVVLTREGCAEEPLFRARLEEALKAMDWPAVYKVVDLATLPRPDGRRGYPIPTVLFGGRDLFGMAEPRAPFPQPT